LNVGYFLSSLVPLRLGDVARAYMTTRLEPPVAAFTAISTIVIERLLDLLALIAMIGLMLLLLDVPSEVTSAGAVVSMMALLASLALAALALKPAWALTVLHWILQRFPLLERFDLQARLHHFIEGVQPMGQPRIAVGALLWTVVSWAFSLAAGYITLFMLFDSPTLAATVSLIVLATLSVALPAVPGNLGPFEGAVVGGLWIGGMVASASPPENAPAVALGVVLHALTLAIYITLGLVGLVVEHASVRQITYGAKSFAEESSTEASAQPRSIARESVS
jgi:hypothetical protein